MIVTSIVLALVAAIIEHFWGLARPWRDIVFAGILLLFICGVVMLLFPGFVPLNLGKW